MSDAHRGCASGAPQHPPSRIRMHELLMHLHACWWHALRRAEFEASTEAGGTAHTAQRCCPPLPTTHPHASSADHRPQVKHPLDPLPAPPRQAFDCLACKMAFSGLTVGPDSSVGLDNVWLAPGGPGPWPSLKAGAARGRELGALPWSQGVCLGSGSVARGGGDVASGGGVVAQRPRKPAGALPNVAALWRRKQATQSRVQPALIARVTASPARAGWVPPQTTTAAGLRPPPPKFALPPSPWPARRQLLQPALSPGALPGRAVLHDDAPSGAVCGAAHVGVGLRHVRCGGNGWVHSRGWLHSQARRQSGVGRQAAEWGDQTRAAWPCTCSQAAGRGQQMPP